MSRIVFLILLLLPYSLASAMPTTSADCVILLHGLGRTANSMNNMEKALQQQGYLTWNQSYPSTKKPIQTLAIEHISQGLSYCNQHQIPKIHFVTHSLGGILTRVYLQDHAISNLGAIVMLSPPNKGSEVADKLKGFKPYQWFTGLAGQDLGTDSNSLPNRLKPTQARIGIIAGDKSSDPWFSPIIAGKDDGKVSVENAKLDEMDDFVIVHAGHTRMMKNAKAIEQTLAFLNNGQFVNNQ